MDCLYLVRNGVPWSVAFSMEPDERMAAVIAMANINGTDFDYNTRQWKARSNA